jgi:hypothetical protein
VGRVAGWWRGPTLDRLRRIYGSSRGWLEIEAFATRDSREVWLTFFDEEGWARYRTAWGLDAFQQPDFDLRRQILGRLRFEGFPEVEAGRLADEMSADVGAWNPP